MKKSITIQENAKVSPFFVLFILVAIQIGIGVLGFQKYIVEGMGYDAWIAILLAGLLVHLYIYMIYSIMKKSNVDIIYLNQILLGKWVGNIVNLIFILYLLFLSLTVLRTYIEIVQVWMYRQLNTWVIAFIILTLVAYVIKGGFRSVVGICFISVVIPSFLVVTLYFPLQYAHFGNLLPLGEFTFDELVTSTRNMVLSYLGFELILFFYPFIKNGETSQRWAHFGNIITIFIYLVIGVVSFAYFSEPYLLKTEWATLSLWKIVEFPFLARFEYIGVTTWLIVILPILCLWLWASSRGIKHLFPKVTQKRILNILLIVIFISVGFIETRSQISLLNTISSRVGLYFLGVYIPLLYLITLFKKEAVES
ncbi:GerAB/ArcD/ProY family transporter [Halobacillus sp. Marseille-Q1614]|uniref:GerAB/ArcD/ProY family transporter n=1 Tax=Halobacillus sp. Marseille-Q1614 TaxID=2709134 RepID=UPI001570C39D|nr:GerAB/ArcD/ProY family transporter [Halobacillus sp. Marseille-Q1614]